MKNNASYLRTIRTTSFVLRRVHGCPHLNGQSALTCPIRPRSIPGSSNRPSKHNTDFEDHVKDYTRMSFGRGVGHDGQRLDPKKAPRDSGKKRKSIAKQQRAALSSGVGAEDEQFLRLEGQSQPAGGATRIKSRVAAMKKQGKTPRQSPSAPRTSRHSIMNDAPKPPEVTSTSVLGLAPKTDAPAIVDNTVATLAGKADEERLNSPPRVSRQRISGEGLRVPRTRVHVEQRHDRKRFASRDFSATHLRHPMSDASLLNLEDSECGSITLSHVNDDDFSVNFSVASMLELRKEDRSIFPERNSSRHMYSVQKANQDGAIFVIPRGVAPHGSSNGAIFNLLARSKADVTWVENSCKEAGDFRLWDRFIAMQVHGPYELLDDEIHSVRSALGAYMSVPFVHIDGCWLYFYRLFLCSLRKPELIRLRQDGVLMANGALIHKLRAGDTSLVKASVVQPKMLKSHAFKTLSKWGLNESDIIMELLMRPGTIRELDISYSGELISRVGDLLEANPRLECLALKSHFPFDRLSGVALGLRRFSASLDSRQGGTARLVSLSLLASCPASGDRPIHRQSLVHILSVAAPKCKTLKTIELVKSNRKSSALLLPAMAALVRLSETVVTVKLTACEIPNEKSRKSTKSTGSSLSSALGSSRKIRHFSMEDCMLSASASLEFSKAFCTAPVLETINISGVCAPVDGRGYLMKVFVENDHLNQTDLMLLSKDIRLKKSNLVGAMSHASILSLVESIGIREKKLVRLDISNMGIGKSGATSLASSIRNCFSLKHFDLSNNSIESVGANAVFQALRRVLTLEELIMNSNNIGDSAAHALSSCIQGSQNLRILSLENNLITNDGGSLVWSAIAMNSESPLVQVNFAANKFDTAWCMTSTFRSVLCLETVVLARNELNQSSARVFADAIVSERWGARRSLTSLDLGGNLLGAEGASLLGRALSKSGTLKLLWLDENKLGSRGGLSIMKALDENRSLTVLDISNNMLALDTRRFSLDLCAVKELAKVLTKNKTLKHLYLKGNQIGASGGKMIKNALPKNRYIQTIVLDNNEIEVTLLSQITNLLSVNVQYANAGLKFQSANDALDSRTSLVEEMPSSLLSKNETKSPFGLTKSGLPSQRSLRKKRQNRPSSPDRSQSRPTPREKIMGVLFQAPINSVPCKAKILDAENGLKTSSTKRYSHEKEDEFYASLVISSRDNDKMSQTKEPLGDGIRPNLHALEPSIHRSSQVAYERVPFTADIPPVRSQPNFNTLNIYGDQGDVGELTLDPRVLVAGGQIALERAARIVAADESTATGGRVDVDALKRAMERMRKEMQE